MLSWASSLGNEVATGCHRRPPNDILHTLQWLEWVPESRGLKPVAINLQKQGELQRASQEAAGEGLPGATQQTNVEVKRTTKGPKTGDGGSPSDTPHPPCHRRPQVDPRLEREESFMSTAESQITIPEKLKRWPVDDGALSTRPKQAASSICQEECGFHSSASLVPSIITSDLMHPHDHRPPGPSVHAILQVIIMEGLTMPSSRGPC